MKLSCNSWDLDHDAATFERLAEIAMDNGNYSDWEIFSKLSEALVRAADVYETLETGE